MRLKAILMSASEQVYFVSNNFGTDLFKNVCIELSYKASLLAVISVGTTVHISAFLDLVNKHVMCL